jgi:hypothetical protein
LIRSITHEYAHAMQSFEGLYAVDGDDFIWKKQRFPYYKTYDEYKDAPWEIDADLRSKELYEFINNRMSIRI